jgi:hypothetical protein
MNDHEEPCILLREGCLPIHVRALAIHSGALSRRPAVSDWQRCGAGLVTILLTARGP